MAPEQTTRPGGNSLPGMPQSALATASPTDDGPSREEVRRRISNLYDQAETATGNYNATRAMTTGTRKRVSPVLDNGRRPADPALDDVARPWFDAVRAQLGPTVPAVLPADRMPDRRPAEARPTSPAGRPGDGPTGRGREPAGRPVLELTAGPAAGARGPVAELTAGPVAELTARPVLELTAGPVAELTARPVLELTAGPAAALPVAPETRPQTAEVLPAPATEPPQSSLRTSKEQIQRKLAMARELLSRYVAQWSTPSAATETWPVEDTWLTFEEQARRQAVEEWQRQQSAGLATDLSTGANLTIGTDLPIDAGSTSDAAYGGKAAKALDFAFGQIGRPCVWGATGPDSYDCSSFTQAAWKAAGVALPRTVHDQAAAGAAASLATVRPGDLIFFHGHVGHVGLYIGNGMMIHAPSPGACIREESILYAGEAAIHSVVRPA